MNAHEIVAKFSSLSPAAKAAIILGGAGLVLLIWQPWKKKASQSAAAAYNPVSQVPQGAAGSGGGFGAVAGSGTPVFLLTTSTPPSNSTSASSTTSTSASSTNSTSASSTSSVTSTNAPQPVPVVPTPDYAMPTGGYLGHPVGTSSNYVPPTTTQKAKSTTSPYSKIIRISAGVSGSSSKYVPNSRKTSSVMNAIVPIISKSSITQAVNTGSTYVAPSSTSNPYGSGTSKYIPTTRANTGSTYVAPSSTSNPYGSGTSKYIPPTRTNTGSTYVAPSSTSNPYGSGTSKYIPPTRAKYNGNIFSLPAFGNNYSAPSANTSSVSYGGGSTGVKIAP